MSLPLTKNGPNYPDDKSPKACGLGYIKGKIHQIPHSGCHNGSQHFLRAKNWACEMIVWTHFMYIIYTSFGNHIDDFSISWMWRIWTRRENWKSWCHADLQNVQNQLSNLSHSHINFPSSIVRFVTLKGTPNIFTIWRYFRFIIKPKPCSY